MAGVIEKEIKNITAERIILGVLLNNPDWLIELNGIIKTDYFFISSHKMIFHLILTLLQEGNDVIDSMSILARAEKIVDASELLKQSGGYEYLEELKYLSDIYTLEDLKKYTEEVTTCAYKRIQISELEKNIDDIKNDTSLSIADCDTRIQEGQQKLLSRFNASKDVGLINDVFDEVWQEIEDNRSGDGIVGIPSHLPMVNKYFTYQNGELTVVGARAKYGKSNWAMNEALDKALNYGIPTAIFDTEMKTRIFITRAVSHLTGIPIDKVADGGYENDPDLVAKVEEAKQSIRNAPLIHHYDPYWTKEKVAHKIKLLKLRYNIGFFIYDYIKVPEVAGGVKEHSELGNWTIFLKNLAGELDIPILTFAQLSPYERRLADSDKINRYASTIAYLVPKEPEWIRRDMGASEGGTDMLYVDYNRIGADMTDNPEVGINLKYTRYLARFEEANYQCLDDDYL